MQTPVKIFVVYAHEDKPVRDKLLRQLRPLADNGEIDLWSDHEIKPGALWDDEIRIRLDQSDIILLLVSDDFFASDYIRRVELQTALDLHAHGKTRLLPVIARHCGWADMTALSRLQALPPEGRPVLSKEWDSPDEPYLKIYEGVKSAVREVRREVVKRTSTEQVPEKTSLNWKPIAFAAVLMLAVIASVWKFIFNPMDTKNPASTSISPSPDSIYSESTKHDTSIVNTKHIAVNETIKDKPGKSDKSIAPPKSFNKPMPDTTKLPEKQLLSKEELEELGLQDQRPPVEGMSRIINKDRKQGYRNVTTNEIIGWYEDAENFYNGRAYVKQNGRYFRIDKTGRCVEKCE
ncbi:MAG TPA: TIR domain-containing protein [Saprospiraceae bacterium]|nr:TIR domain-containing protein [Saprospiraceae bacterium]